MRKQHAVRPLDLADEPKVCQSPLPEMCLRDATMTDAVGMTWCDEHAHRGELLNWGDSRGWPELSCPPLYAIGAFEAAWVLVAGFGSEDMVLLLLVAIEEKERAA